MNKIGEAKIMNNGQVAKIVAYRAYNDIDVRFSDGFLAENKRYDHFKTGSIKNPNLITKAKRSPNTAIKAAKTKLSKSKEKHIGETRKMANGLSAEIIEYNRYDDIIIQFEDGYITNTKYNYFFKGHVKHPKHKGVTAKRQVAEKAKTRVGETAINNQGLKMKIIAYRTNVDMDVAFETGQVRKGVRYSNFVRGSISPIADIKEMREGQTVTASDGSIVTLIKYNNASDITVRFEDGTERKVTYASFKNGVLSPKKDEWMNYIGSIRKSSCGLNMALLEGMSPRDVSVKFEDGTIVEHKRLRYFLSGNIAHPVLSHLGTHRSYFGFKNLKKAFKLQDGRCFYYALSPEMEWKILTPQEMLSFN